MSDPTILVDYTCVWNDKIKQTVKAQLNTKTGKVIALTPVSQKNMKVTNTFIEINNEKLIVTDGYINQSSLNYINMLSKKRNPYKGIS